MCINAECDTELVGGEWVLFLREIESAAYNGTVCDRDGATWTDGAVLGRRRGGEHSARGDVTVVRCESATEVCTVRLNAFITGGLEVRTGPDMEPFWTRG